MNTQGFIENTHKIGCAFNIHVTVFTGQCFSYFLQGWHMWVTPVLNNTAKRFTSLKIEETSFLFLRDGIMVLLGVKLEFWGS